MRCSISSPKCRVGEKRDVAWVCLSRGPILWLFVTLVWKSFLHKAILARKINDNGCGVFLLTNTLEVDVTGYCIRVMGTVGQGSFVRFIPSLSRELSKFANQIHQVLYQRWQPIPTFGEIVLQNIPRDEHHSLGVV